jgi:ornithine cyclodeaminase/alanine dehydrogenase-like protein (mu-crystallin family)
VFACDLDPARAAGLAKRGAERRLALAPGDLDVCAPLSDIIVTCTTSQAPYLQPRHVSPGTFVAAVGADSGDKAELAPELLRAATLVTDVTAQCEVMGDLRSAIEASLMTSADVHAELGELVLGTRPGRRTREEITVFDSTGVAAQDLAAAAELWRRATAVAEI